MHTTSELLKQALLDIRMHPDLIPALRDEAQKAVEESGWTTAGVFKMQLLDSAVKETQRLKPGSLGMCLTHQYSHIKVLNSLSHSKS